MTIKRKKLPRRVLSNREQQRVSIDWPFLGIVMVIIAFGLLMVFDASIVEAYLQHNDKYHYLKLQSTWALIGLISLIIMSFTPLNWYKTLSKPLFIISLILLILVLIPGIGTKVAGARRWLYFGSFSFQPSELIKLSVSLYFSSWLSVKQALKPFLASLGTILFLLMLQPDMGTSLVVASIGIGLYFLSGAPFKRLLTIIILGLLIGSVLILSTPYRRERLNTFLDPSIDPLGSSYHIRQVMISLGSGNWFGTGVGRSRQKFQYLPEATTDSIFAVIAEEMGFVGAGLIVITYLGLIIRGLNVAQRITDPYAQLLAAGSIIWISSQTFINLGAMVILVPLTGIPLPLISYGGSSLITTMMAIGVYLQASRYRAT